MKAVVQKIETDPSAGALVTIEGDLTGKVEMPWSIAKAYNPGDNVAISTSLSLTTPDASPSPNVAASGVASQTTSGADHTEELDGE